MQKKQRETERQIRKSQLKPQWNLKCQKITEAEILCGEQPWTLRNQNCFSLYLSIGTGGRRLFTQNFPHNNVYDLMTLKLWEMLEHAFIHARNITFDRYVFFQKTKERRDKEQIYNTLKELAENCDFAIRDEAKIGGIFITKLLEDDAQREFVRDTCEPERALSVAVNNKKGHRIQQRISSNNTSGIKVIQQFTRFRGANTRTQQCNRNRFNLETNSLCRNCEQNWTSTNRQVCPALGMKCNHWELLKNKIVTTKH